MSRPVTALALLLLLLNLTACDAKPHPPTTTPPAPVLNTPPTPAATPDVAAPAVASDTGVKPDEKGTLLPEPDFKLGSPALNRPSGKGKKRPSLLGEELKN